MSERPRIVVTVRPDGTVSAETKDILGESCLDYVSVLEDLLAAEAVESAYTADRHRTATDVVHDTARESRNVHRSG